jgi:glycosyl transferase family 25
MDNIERVIYINLDHRTDRKQEVETELLKVFPSQKIERFSAIYEKTRGHLGCTKSHIAVLEMAIANNWKNYLVVEDDMIWDDFEKNSYILNDIFYKNPDVIVFGGISILHDTKTYKLHKSCCTTSYLVFNHYTL